MLAPWNKSYDKPRKHIKKQRHHFANKGPSTQGYGFSSSHVWMWELDHKESSAPKNWCFWTVVLEKTLESPLDCKEIKPVHPKGNQSWIFIGRTDAEAEAPVFWSPYANSQLIEKVPDAGKDWGHEEKRMTEDEMVGWHHQLNGYVWANSRRQWRTEKHGMLQSQRVQHDIVTEQQQQDIFICKTSKTVLPMHIFKKK